MASEPRISSVESAVVCGLCGSEEVTARFEKDGSRFYRCRACAFQFSRSDTNANLEQPFEDYERAYLQYLDESPVDRVNHDATIAWMEQYRPFDDPGVSMLDVGAGSGKWLRHVRTNRRCQVAGLEPSAALYRAFRLDGLGVANQTLPELAAGGRTFDVVTAFDVIEHVDDSVEFAASLYQVTTPGGFVFLSTPDAGSLVPRVLGRRWYHYNRYHLSLFDPRTIARLGRDAGFEIVTVAHRGKRFSPGYLQRYLRDYLLRAGSRDRTASHGGLTVYLNFFDIMSAVWRRPKPADRGRPEATVA